MAAVTIHCYIHQNLEKCRLLLSTKGYDHEDAAEGQLAFISCGVSNSLTKAALRRMGVSAPVLKLSCVNPINEDLVASFSENLDTVLVLEEGEAFIEERVAALLQRRGMTQKVLGRLSKDIAYGGELFVGDLERILRKVLIQVAYQRVYFTRFESFMPQPLYAEEASGEPLAQGRPVIALSGIGNPKPFVQTLRERYEVVADMMLVYHHVYKVRDMNALAALLEKHPGAVIVTTEKDAVKMTNRAKIPAQVRSNLYYLPINISFIEDSATDFLQKLEEDVRGN